jgi:steroid delta-isomerase-like uncharacterized protein
MSADEARAIGHRIIEELDRRNLEGVTQLAAADARWHGFAGPEALDTEGYRQMMTAFLQAFPDSRFTLEEVIAEGDRAAVRHTFRGTHQGEFNGIPATGKAVVVSATYTFHLRGGKMTEGWLNADFLGLLQQLGAVPAPGQAATP